MAAAEEAPAGRGRWRKRLLVAGAVLLALAIVVRVALPYAVAAALPKLAERFGFAASVAHVHFAVLAGHVEIDDLHVAPLPKDGAAPAHDLFSLGRGFVNLEWLRLLRGELMLADATFEQPVLSLVRARDGYIELPALPAGAPEPEPKPEAKPSKPLPIIVKALSIRGTEFHLLDGGGGANLVDFALAELAFRDLRLLGSKVGLGGIDIREPRLSVRREVQATRAGARGAQAAAPAAGAAASPPPDLRIDDLEIERAEFSVLTDGEPVSVALHLKTTGVSLAPNAPFPLEFGLEAGTGKVTLVGQLGLNPVVWDGKVVWQGLGVPMFVRAALPSLIPWIHSCSASGDLDVHFRPDGVRASGTLGVDDFRFEDPEQQLALAWKSLAIGLTSAEVPLAGAGQPIQLALGKISLDAPEARYALPNTAIERIGAALGAAPEKLAEQAPATTEPAPAAAPAPQPRISIDTIEVRHGSAEFVDRSGKEPYQGRIRDLTVDAAGVKLPERTVQKLRVRGIAPERAPFDLQASLPGPRGTLNLELEGLPLAQFDPYASSAADLRIPSGDLTLSTKGTLSNGGAAGKLDTKLVVHRLSIRGGPNAISVAGMPLDLALALLRDPKGDIALPIPLTYGAKGASAGVGTILLGALSAALTGAVTSPIKALGLLLPEGGGAQVSFSPIAFAPGDATVTPEASQQLTPLAALLAQRPALGLALIGTAGEGDRLALAEQILIERVAKGDGLPPLEDAGFFARRRVAGALADRGKGEPGALEPEDQALLARYLEATKVPPERYADLARRRAEALRDALATAHGVAPARLSAEVGREPGAPGATPELRAGAGAP